MASVLSRKSGKGCFEIESAMLTGRAHTTSGARSPNDDIVDTLYMLLAYLIGPHPEPPDLMVVLAGLSVPPEEVAP
jgi:hypothetical protein